jgi:hypothetical protein
MPGASEGGSRKYLKTTVTYPYIYLARVHILTWIDIDACSDSNGNEHANTGHCAADQPATSITNML